MRNLIKMLLSITIGIALIVISFSFGQDGANLMINDFEENPDLPGSMINGNIYKSAYEKVKANETFSKKESTKFVVNFLKKEAERKEIDECSVTENHITTIRSFSASALSETLFGDGKLEGEKFVNSCKEMMRCIGEGNSIQGNTYTLEARKTCIDNVKTITQLANQNMQTLSSMKDSIKGESTFINGSLKDSPYDLMTDIENIQKILIKSEGEKAYDQEKDINFFDLDTKNDSLRDSIYGPMNDNNVNDDDLNSGNSVNNGISGSENTGDSDMTAPDESGYETNENTIQQITQNDNNNLQGSNSSDNQNSSSPVINNNIACLTGMASNALENGGNRGDNEGADSNSGITGGGSGDSNDGQQSEGNVDDKSGVIENFAGDNPEKIVEDMTNNLPESDEKDRIKSCMANASSPEGKLKCLCNILEIWQGKGKGRNSNIYVQYCLVPSRSESVVSTTWVDSIEGVLDEVNNVLLSLKNSGQLIKHKKTDQAMELGIQDANFEDMLVFNLITSWKPVFPETDKKQKKKKKQSKSESFQRIAGLKRGSIDTYDEKNKYVSLWNDKAYNQQKSASPSLEQFENTPSNLEDTMNEMNNKVNAVKSIQADALKGGVKAQISSFIKNNSNFLEKVTKKMVNIQSTSKDFKNRIEKTAK